MAYFCFKCRNELELIITVGVKVGRLDTCPHCGAYMHCCKNCGFYDASVHNECLETQADFIRDRETANFCHHYFIKDREAAPEVDDGAARARSRLDQLFKGLK
ncbi:MAG: hypothetical protein IPL40_13840 [Proteobacteria bacterium]|nr:hypothetical protein [Pseudomonadota bacterium]